MGNLARYQQRISALAPELAQESVVLNQVGLVNDVVIVNDEFVFRFPKQEHAFRHLPVETSLLRLLPSFISLLIPVPTFEAHDCFGYRLIPGETLRRDMLLKLADEDQQAVADQVAQFLKELHGVPTKKITEFDFPLADALMKYEGWVGVYDRIREKVFPLLMPHLRDWATEHFESHLADQRNFDYELKLVHTDLPPYHILFDRQSQRVNGIIDFGCAGLGDPAIDFGVLIYNYGENFVRRFYEVYPEAETSIRRARFYAGAHEVRWLLTGIERNDPWWFAVHVGSAKDIAEASYYERRFLRRDLTRMNVNKLFVNRRIPAAHNAG